LKKKGIDLPHPAKERIDRKLGCPTPGGFCMNIKRKELCGKGLQEFENKGDEKMQPHDGSGRSRVCAAEFMRNVSISIIFVK
jgi:hypothetical protein